MYLCICNKVTEKDLKEYPQLLDIIGSKCGKCIFDGGEVVSTNRIESINESPFDNVIIN